MKKALCIFLAILTLMCCLTACQNKDKTDTTITPPSTEETPSEPTVPEVDPGLIEYFLDGDFKSKVSLVFPEEVRDNYHTEYSTSYTDGWCQITFCLDKDLNGPTYYLFTLYCSKDKSYEKYKDKQGYEVIGTNGIYTLIWYEHDPRDGVMIQSVLDEIDVFESKYKEIKASLTIEK